VWWPMCSGFIQLYTAIYSYIQLFMASMGTAALIGTTGGLLEAVCGQGPVSRRCEVADDELKSR